jgi:hypothetical protein
LFFCFKFHLFLLLPLLLFPFHLFTLGLVTLLFFYFVLVFDFFWDSISLCAQAGLKLVIPASALICWDYRHVPPCPGRRIFNFYLNRVSLCSPCWPWTQSFSLCLLSTGITDIHHPPCLAVEEYFLMLFKISPWKVHGL